MAAIDDLVVDRQKFNAFTYLPLRVALEELALRRADASLAEYVASSLPQGLPELMRDGPHIAIFRHVATSNYEIIRFMIAANTFPDLRPLILEYGDDRFLDRNDWKHSLGRLVFCKGIDKWKHHIYETETIINFNESNNTPISHVVTLWGEKLVDFHHQLFLRHYPTLDAQLYDLSAWLHQVGGSAKAYYKRFLTLFLRGGILLENFLLDDKEGSFTAQVVVPAIKEIEAESGKRPLIVALEPTEIEGDKFWLSHPWEDCDWVRQKIINAT